MECNNCLGTGEICIDCGNAAGQCECEDGGGSMVDCDVCAGTGEEDTPDDDDDDEEDDDPESDDEPGYGL